MPLPTGRERSLLALLAVHYPDSVTTARLIEELWEGQPPAGAAATLRSYVSTLRRALRTEGLAEMVTTGRRGYALSPLAGESLDARLFESLIRQARRRRTTGDLGGGIRTWHAALSLWRGPAFGDVAPVPAVAEFAAYLEEARVIGVEEWVEARLEAGEHADLAPELGALCAEYPLRERLWWARMLALYRSGRQADALSAYQQIRDQLRVELGIQPGEKLRALHMAIVRQDPALSAPASRRPARPEPPLPVALPVPAAGRFVGRSAELNALRVAWSLALTGVPQLAFVHGEPGAGKSTLAGAFAQLIGGERATVLAGRCEPDAAAPYQPLREALAPLLAVHPGAAGGLTVLFPEHATAADDLQVRDPATARRRAFDAAAELLAICSSAAPVAIVLEDLQWADPSSLLLLRHIARRVRSGALLILGTYRSTDVEPSDPLLQTLDELGQAPGFASVGLGGLEESDVVSLLAASGAGSLYDVPALGAALHRATEGNPLFVTQMLAHLSVAPERFLSESGAVRPDLPLPSGIRDAIGQRLSRLPPGVRDVLTVAAVIGTEFDLDLLEAVAGEAEPISAVEHAERAGLIVELSGGAERFRFSHELIRQALYTSAGRPRRARLHQRVGDALERLAGDDPGTLALLADHFAAAARRGQTARAAGYALRAARQSLDQLAFAEAASCAERGLRCVELERQPDLERRCELQLVLAEARLLARDIAGCKVAAAQAGDDARARGSVPQLARAAIIGSYLNSFGQPSEVTARLCHDALHALGDADAVATAQILAGLADYTAASEGDAPRAAHLSERALAIARACGDADAQSRALFVHGDVISWGPDVDGRLRLAEQLLELSRRHGDQRAEANGRYMRARARLESGDVAGFDADRAAIEALRARVDYWYIDVYALLWRGMRALLDGRLDEVETHAGELLGHARHEPNVVNLYAGQLILLRREQRRLGELRSLVLDAIAQNPQVAGFRCAMAMIHAELGEPELAEEQLTRLSAGGFAALPRDATWTTSLALLADVAVAVGHEDHARTLYGLLAPYAGLVLVATNGMACMGAADRFLGLLAWTMGHRRQAEGYLRSAVALEQRLGSVTLANRSEQALHMVTSAAARPAAGTPGAAHVALTTSADPQLLPVPSAARSIVPGEVGAPHAQGSGNPVQSRS